jgi:signal transduction histidine kinase
MTYDGRVSDAASNPVPSVAALEAALRREQKKAALVQEVSRALSSALPLDQLLVLIMERVTRLMECDRSTLYLMTEDRTALWSKVVQGGEVVDIRLRVGEGLAGSVAASGEILNLPDVYTDQRFQPTFDLKSGYRTRSMLAVPMRNNQGVLVGVLQCLNKQDGPFTSSDEELLTALASQAAIAIDNAKLYHSVVAQNVELERARAELQQRTREVEALYQVEQELSAALDLDDLLARILAQAIAVLGATAGSIALVDGEGGLRFRTSIGPAAARLGTRTIRIGDGVIGWSVAHRQPVIVNDPAHDERHAAEVARELGSRPNSILAAPLLDGDDLVGGIEVLDRIGDEQFDDADLRLLVLIAAQVAKAIGLERGRSERTNRDRLASIGRMMAGVLHDLKTPMTIISGYAQLMAACDDAAQREQYVEQILRQFDIMTAMTREVLAFARGDADLVIRKVYLHRFLDELHHQLKSAMAGRNITVALEAGYDGVALFDEQKIMRVAHNLARNAAEAMPDGGNLTIRTARDGDQLVLSIIDDGPGIPEEIQGRLFELFASGKRGGTGLGLAIVRKIVDDHRGTIAWTTGPTGTAFHIRLPMDRAETAAVPPPLP